MNELLNDYWVTGDGLRVDDPATGDEIGRVADHAPSTVNAIIDEAAVAMGEWASRTAKERAGILMTWRNLLLENQEALAQIVTAESGKPIGEARGEVAFGAGFIEWFAEEGKRVYGDIVPTHAPGKRIAVLKQPIGVTAAITPWNFPVAMIARKVGPALAVGCPMIVKPAEATPLSALAMEKLAHQAGVPRSVFRVVTTTNPSAIGEIFCANPTVRKLSFTGSTRVGKLLARLCADTVKRVSLELGGNAPFIVFEDADLDAAVEGAMVSKYRNAGQTCVCANRILVQRSVHDAFVEKLKSHVDALTVGPGADGPDIGPLINTQAADKVASLVDEAMSSGAQSVVGGGRSTLGPAYFQPTILTAVETSMRVAREEIFGPVAAVIPFDDEDEAVRIANDTPYGLAAYFYAKDMARIWRVMERLEYGMVGVNEGLISTEVAPFGGVKESGIGREGSRYGVDEYLEIKYCLLGGL
ncbi:MAG: NAD-dependent succinate-semialdehyde dehydrogenase [Pseudomonadota bacterium]